MFQPTISDIDGIRADYGIPSQAVSFTELQRYHYGRENPDTKEVRLIVKVELCDGAPIVIRFKYEADVTLELIEAQSRFAALLGAEGVETPRQYQAGGRYANWYSIDGYDVIVTVEQFVTGELRCVTPELAMETGQLLARTHNIAQRAGFHVENPVLFDPFGENDLFAFTEFQKHGAELSAVDAALYDRITETYQAYRQKLSPLQQRPRFAVQGDISNCNLYRTPEGRVGIFDFNRCGDNVPYCDAVMQAVFEARLMDYPPDCAGDPEPLILPAFLQGYQRERPFSDLERELYPYLYAIISAFWYMDIQWKENSLLNALERGDTECVRQWLREIHRRLCCLPPIPC